MTLRLGAEINRRNTPSKHQNYVPPSPPSPVPYAYALFRAFATDACRLRGFIVDTMRHWEVTLLTMAPANTECLTPKVLWKMVGL